MIKRRNVHRFFKSWWSKLLLKPIIVAFPFGAISFYFQVQAIQTKIQTEYSWLSSALDNNPIISLAFACGWFYFATIIFGYYEQCPEDYEVEEVFKFVNTIEQVVGVKADRFGRKLSQLKGSIDASELFDQITQPEQQIALLTVATYTFFETIDTHGAQIRVRIASIKDNKPEAGWLFFAPPANSPRTSLRDLDRKDSALMICVKKKRIHIVEDIKKEGSKRVNRGYVPIEEGDDNGSLITYPIIHPQSGRVVYVLCISSNLKKYFTNKKKHVYEMYLRQFALRMSLEHSLLLLKQRALAGVPPAS